MRAATYALYRGDELVDVGTARELAGRMGVTAEYVRWMATPTARRRDGAAGFWHTGSTSRGTTNDTAPNDT